MKHPLRRFASSPQGDHTNGPAKPAPGCVLGWHFFIRCTSHAGLLTD